MKKWKLVIPIAAVVAFLAWYAFRPERLVINRRVDEAMPGVQGSSRPSVLPRDSFTASCTQRQVPQPSTGWAMAVVFFALRVLAHQMALMCTSTWLPPTMQKTVPACCARVLSTWGPSRGMWATKTILSVPMWTCRNIARFQRGANGSASILARLH